MSEKRGKDRFSKAALIRTKSLIETVAARAGPGALLGAAAAAMTDADPVLAAAGGALTGVVLASGKWLEDELKERREIEKAQARDEEETKKIFKLVFGHLEEEWSYALGRQDYPNPTGFHPDNRAAGKALVRAFGMLDQKPESRKPSDPALEIDPNVDLVLIGGANSTPYTQAAWEFDGPSDRKLRRPEKPILPLRFYGLSDATDPELAQGPRIGWYLETVGLVDTVNWSYVDTYNNNKRITPQRGNQIRVTGKDVYEPLDNYLLVTRLPNFLSAKSLAQSDPGTWPRLVALEGNHGLGTRAAELLKGASGLTALKELRSVGHGLCGATAFQVLFRVTDLELVGRGRNKFHKFHSIELKPDCVQPLDIDTQLYREAHKKAWEILERIGLTESRAEYL